MIMDGIMKQNSKNLNLRLLIIPLIVFAIVKTLWVIIEFKWLPAIGVDHIANRDIKALYYRVKLAHKEHHIKTPKYTVTKPISSIKDIKLLAIYASDNYAVITVEYKRKTKVLATGDIINGFKLIHASMEYAIFSKGNKTYKLELPKTKQQNSYISPIIKKQSIKKIQKKIQPSPEESITKSGEYIVIDKKVFKHFTENIDDIYKNIGIQDIRKNNKMIFKVSFIKRGSIFAKLGLKRGDIIKSVNGEEIDSYNKAFSIYRGVKDMQNLTITVIRNNKEVELEYEIN